MCEIYLCSFTFAHSHLLIYICSFTCAHSHVLIYMCSFTFAHLLVLIHMCSFTCAHLHVLIYMCSFTCAKWLFVNDIRPVTQWNVTWICNFTFTWILTWTWYGVAMICRLFQNIGLFWGISSLLQGSFAKETYIFREPTHRSRPIFDLNLTHLPDTVQGPWVMSHIELSHVTHMDESWHISPTLCSLLVAYILQQTLQHVLQHALQYALQQKLQRVGDFCAGSMSHVAYRTESCHTYGWVMSHIWMSHVTHEAESCHTSEWVTSHMKRRIL